ncbi:hypothetical protein BHE74_00031841 [Ensete ventricosum]|nr:hypothetical protein GW17_00046112 [Ensete ventricosum]RWW61118.1 hypothetical protein BHE74_00031841 [Ensete ventricosum]RZS08947.1 hypothetical protein BHM03_00039987 [Ensete ventricosum]
MKRGWICLPASLSSTSCNCDTLFLPTAPGERIPRLCHGREQGSRAVGIGLARWDPHFATVTRLPDSWGNGRQAIASSPCNAAPQWIV